MGVCLPMVRRLMAPWTFDLIFRSCSISRSLRFSTMSCHSSPGGGVGVVVGVMSSHVTYGARTRKTRLAGAGRVANDGAGATIHAATSTAMKTAIGLPRSIHPPWRRCGMARPLLRLPVGRLLAWGFRFGTASAAPAEECPSRVYRKRFASPPGNLANARLGYTGAGRPGAGARTFSPSLSASGAEKGARPSASLPSHARPP